VGRLGELRELERDQSKIHRIDVGGSRPNPFLIGGLPAFKLTGSTFNKQVGLYPTKLQREFAYLCLL
jgi:hypothetical protein